VDAGFGLVLVHWFWDWLIRCEVNLGALPLPFARWGLVFPAPKAFGVRAATATAPYDQCDRLEEELEVAQSKASNEDD
jgi:hypothetical protein